jgi:diguanylate cyclase (GGDEF)-like protein
VSLTVFIVGLPYYQSSLSVVIGHGVNVGIFVILSWLMARILYSGYVKGFISRREIDRKNQLLNDINQRLTDEIRLRKMIQEDLERANRELEELSLIDDLTGIPNRRSLDNFLNIEWKRAIREGNSVSLLMIDIDYFKLFNDNYGHLAGDDCLIRVARALRGSCRRPSDFVARLGGEEFLFVAIHLDEAGAKKIAENIRETVQSLNIKHEYSQASPYVTISLGITVVKPSVSDTPGDAINKADRALYIAKLAGRNRVGS